MLFNPELRDGFTWEWGSAPQPKVIETIPFVPAISSEIKEKLIEEFSLYQLGGGEGDVIIDLSTGYAYDKNSDFHKFRISSAGSISNTQSALVKVNSNARRSPYRHVETFPDNWRRFDAPLTLGAADGLDSRGEAAYAMLGIDSPNLTMDAGFYSASWYKTSREWGGFAAFKQGQRQWWIDLDRGMKHLGKDDGELLETSARPYSVIAKPNAPAKITLSILKSGENTWITQSLQFTDDEAGLTEHTFVYPMPDVFGERRVRMFRSASLLSVDGASHTGTNWWQGTLTKEGENGLESVAFDNQSARVRSDVNEHPMLTCNPHNYDDGVTRVSCREGSDFTGVTDFSITVQEFN